MSTSKKYFFWYGLVALVIAVGCFLVYQSLGKGKPVQFEQTIRAHRGSLDVANVLLKDTGIVTKTVAGWNHYTNKELGFSLEYPGNIRDITEGKDAPFPTAPGETTTWYYYVFFDFDKNNINTPTPIDVAVMPNIAQTAQTYVATEQARSEYFYCGIYGKDRVTVDAQGAVTIDMSRPCNIKEPGYQDYWVTPTKTVFMKSGSTLFKFVFQTDVIDQKTITRITKSIVLTR